MKKNLFAFMAILGLIGIFSACSSEDKDDQFIIDEELIGQWNLSTEGPTTIQWDAKEGIVSEDFTLHIPEIAAIDFVEQDLQIAFITNFVGPNVVSPMIAKLLQSVTFQKDGNITAMYFENEEWKSSPVGLITYGVIGKNELLSVKLYADNIIDLAGITDEKLVKALKTAFKDRISLKYSITNDALSVYIDKDCLNKLLPRIKSILKDLNLDKETMDIINTILTQIPGVMEKT